MEQFRLRAGVSHRSFADCAIILDVDRDRYWLVGPETALALDGLCGRSAQPVDPEQIDRLCELRLVERDDGSPIAASPPPSPNASAIEGGDAPQLMPGDAFKETIEIGWRCLRARHLVRRQPLATILNRLRKRRATMSLMTDVATGSDQFLLARRFKRGRRTIPLASKCLPDTLAFLGFMARRGHFPELVFGVEAYPFAAHCWAQADGVVLNDALDHARRFAPILSV